MGGTEQPTKGKTRASKIETASLAAHAEARSAWNAAKAAIGTSREEELAERWERLDAIADAARKALDEERAGRARVRCQEFEASLLAEYGVTRDRYDELQDSGQWMNFTAEFQC